MLSPQMEPTMISLRVLSTAAAMALLLPMVAATASFAQPIGKAAAGRGGVGPPAASVGSGGGAVYIGRGSGGPPVAGVGGGGGPVYIGRGSGGPPVAQFSGGGGVYHGGHRRRGFFPGAVGGGIIVSPGYGYYGGPAYYDDQYYESVL
jgi:hypothetical protein